MTSQRNPSERSRLQADSLIQGLHEQFEEIPDHRDRDCKISLPDALMAGFAVFALKQPSLLAFQAQMENPNLRTIYKIESTFSDTQMRTILDPVDPKSLRPCFTKIFSEIQRANALQKFVFYKGHYLLSCDGTTHFTSKKIECPHCLEQHHRNGTITYKHQMYAGAIVHPDMKVVVPVCPEAIIKEDGSSKNDCERNAAKRFLDNFRKDHPLLKVIVIEDSLSSNGPHIETLRTNRMRFILGVKKGDHESLFEEMQTAVEANKAMVLTLEDEESNLHHFRWINDASLNKSNPNIKVNLLEYWEIDNKGNVLYFSWVTDLELSPESVWTIMRGGRARWKIENETFNTLKNQGYHFEHNFGHGKANLATIFALLMMLAFLVDQVQFFTSWLFQEALVKFKSKRRLWERILSAFTDIVFTSMRALLKALLEGVQRPSFAFDDTS